MSLTKVVHYDGVDIAYFEDGTRAVVTESGISYIDPIDPP